MIPFYFPLGSESTRILHMLVDLMDTSHMVPLISQNFPFLFSNNAGFLNKVLFGFFFFAFKISYFIRNKIYFHLVTDSLAWNCIF